MKNKKNEVREERRQTGGAFVPTNNPPPCDYCILRREEPRRCRLAGDSMWRRTWTWQLRAGVVSYLIDTLNTSLIRREVVAQRLWSDRKKRSGPGKPRNNNRPVLAMHPFAHSR
jgi:hypothetical protein